MKNSAKTMMYNNGDMSSKANSNFKRFDSQAGWTIWSMMFVLGVLFIAAYVGMQLVPIFSTNENIKKAMLLSVEDKDLRKITKRQVMDGMNRQLYLDGSHNLLDYKKSLKVARTRNQFVLEVSYEREVPLVANLFLIARFNPKVECELNGRCDL